MLEFLFVFLFRHIRLMIITCVILLALFYLQFIFWLNLCSSGCDTMLLLFYSTKMEMAKWDPLELSPYLRLMVSIKSYNCSKCFQHFQYCSLDSSYLDYKGLAILTAQDDEWPNFDARLSYLPYPSASK